MPFSPDKSKFFIHIPKTAGVSVLSALGHPSSFIGPFSYQRYKNSWSQRYKRFLKRLLFRSISERQSQSYSYLIGSGYLPMQHMTFQEVANLGLLHQQHEVFSFTIVRNPYSRLISTFNYISSGEMSLDTFYSTYLSGIYHQDFWLTALFMRPQYLYVQHNGILSKDIAIIHLENMHQEMLLYPELHDCLSKLTAKPRLNSSNYASSDKYSLSAFNLAHFQGKYSQDFSLFGYLPSDIPSCLNIIQNP